MDSDKCYESVTVSMLKEGRRFVREEREVAL